MSCVIGDSDSGIDGTIRRELSTTAQRSEGRCPAKHRHCLRTDLGPSRREACLLRSNGIDDLVGRHDEQHRGVRSRA